MNPVERTVAWIDLYETAWRTAGTALLSQLFTDDARYVAAPFDDPIVGLAAIERFWDAEREGPDESFSLTSSVVAADHAVGVARLEVSYGGPPRRRYRDLWVLHFRDQHHVELFEEWPFHPGQARVAPGALTEPG